MSRKYYYLVASLPMLEFLGRPSMTTDEFISDCERLLAAQDLIDLKEALSEKPRPELVKSKVVKEWIEFGRRFKNEIAWSRANDAHKDPSNYIRGDRYVEPSLVEVVAEAVKASDPLEAEKVLDRARWNKLTDFEMEHMYDLETVIIYGLKLKILERYKEIESDKGKTIFEGYKDMELPDFELV